MVIHVLVAFATKHGSTGEIAAAIGSTLRDSALEAALCRARDVSTLAPYDAVVLGSALYSAHWQRDANRFVKRHLAELQKRPVWLFSSGPLDHSAEFGDIPLTEHVAPDLAPIGARGHRTFGGRLLNGTPGVSASMLATHRTGDFRNWDHIDAWAREIARALVKLTGPTSAH